MSATALWFVLGLVLLIAELLTGTFYLLVIAIAFAAGGLVGLAGGALVWQLLVTAALGVAGSLWLRRWRAQQAARSAGADALQNLDLGQTVQVEAWTANGTARAPYRGALWDVELAPGELPRPGEFTIQSIHANRLVVTPARRTG
jgi:membrane protein implicated in regulation of membrane protease activity